MKTVFTLMIFLLSTSAFSQLSIFTEDCVIETKNCPVTGKELIRFTERPNQTWYYSTPSYCVRDDGQWLDFTTGKYIDKGLYDEIKPEFDSIMRTTFDGYFQLLLKRYEADRQDNQQSLNERKQEEKKIEILKAEIELAKLKGESPKQEHIEELCGMAEKLDYWGILFEYCDMQIKSIPIDSVIIIVPDRE